MKEAELKKRTKLFTSRIIRLVDDLPKTTTGRAFGGRLIRCGTSVGVNYRSACRARSEAEFISKFGIVLEEADESGFCPACHRGIIIDGNLIKTDLVRSILNEANESIAIFTSSINSVPQGRIDKSHLLGYTEILNNWRSIKI